jgi:hypothetical protein
MCGRVRLSSDYSEIKIRLKFAADAPAPNFAPYSLAFAAVRIDIFGQLDACFRQSASLVRAPNIGF